MPMQGAMPVGVALLLVLSSCTTLPVTTTWPEPTSPGQRPAGVPAALATLRNGFRDATV
jgi:hypothetical protein